MPENIAAALKGLGVTLVMLAAFLIIAALLLVFTDLHESTVKTITPFVCFGSVFCGAFTAASQNGHQGLWQGEMVAAGFLLLLLPIFIILDVTSLNYLHLAISIILAGGLGGIVGIMLN